MGETPTTGWTSLASASSSWRPGPRCIRRSSSRLALCQRLDAVEAQAARPVPLHGELGALADRRGAARAPHAGCGRGPKRGQPPEAAAPERRAGDVGARDRHLGAVPRSISTASCVTRFDRVITLCDKVKEICPEFPGAPLTAHWSMADPAAAAANDEDSYPAFVRAADEIEVRVDLLIAELAHSGPTGRGASMSSDETRQRALHGQRRGRGSGRSTPPTSASRSGSTRRRSPTSRRATSACC